MDKLAQQTADVMRQLSTLGPDIQQAALGSMQMHAWSVLALAILWLAIGAALAAFIWRVVKPKWLAALHRDNEVHGFLEADTLGYGVTTVVGGIVTACILLVSVNIIFDPATYISIRHPEYLIVQKVLDKL